MFRCYKLVKKKKDVFFAPKTRGYSYFRSRIRSFDGEYPESNQSARSSEEWPVIDAAVRHRYRSDPMKISILSVEIGSIPPCSWILTDLVIYNYPKFLANAKGKQFHRYRTVRSIRSAYDDAFVGSPWIPYPDFMLVHRIFKVAGHEYLTKFQCSINSFALIRIIIEYLCSQSSTITCSLSIQNFVFVTYHTRRVIIIIADNIGNAKFCCWCNYRSYESYIITV